MSFQLALTGILFSTLAGAQVTLPASFAHRPIPSWHNGFAVAMGPEHTGVEVYNRKGELQAHVRPEFRGAGCSAVSASTSRDGIAAIFFIAVDGGGQPTRLIGWYSATGQLIRTVDTGDYVALRVAFAPNGILWAAGYEQDTTRHAVPNRPVVRRYAPDGRLLGESLDSSTFEERDVLVQFNLVTSKDRVAVVSGWAKVMVILGPDGQEIERQPVPALAAREQIQGVALVAGDEVLFALQRDDRLRYAVARAGEWIAADQYRSADTYALIGGDNGAAVNYGQGRISFAPGH
jgi:hypothetical protein